MFSYPDELCHPDELDRMFGSGRASDRPLEQSTALSAVVPNTPQKRDDEMMNPAEEEITFARTLNELVEIETIETLLQAVNAFLVLHVGPKSASYNEWCRKRLKNVVKVLGPTMPIKKIQIWHLDLWYAGLASRNRLYENHKFHKPIENQKLSASTLRGYVRAVKTLFGWLGERRMINADPASLLELTPVPKMPPKAATEDEVRTLLTWAKKTGSLRHYAALRLLVQTGIRAGGLEGLTLTDVSLSGRWAMVWEKGRGGERKARFVPFDTITANALRDYLERERPKEANTNAFFVSDDQPYRAWSRHALNQMMRRASEATSQSRNIHPHMFRHTFAFRSAMLGMPVPAIQEIMGHDDIETTMIYVRLLPTAQHKAYDQIYTPETDIERA